MATTSWPATTRSSKQPADPGCGTTGRGDVPSTSERTNERRPVTRLDPAVRRIQIVEAAARLFEHHDPLVVTFEEIADAAGVSRALVYNYFGDRGGLLAAVFLHHFDAVNADIRAAVADAVSPEERFGCTVRAYLEFARAHPGAWRLLSATRANEHPAVLQAREQRMVELAETWGGTTEARIVAYALVGMLEAATLDWLRATDEVPLDAVAAILLDLIWRGMPGLAEHGIVAG
jgi:AcrR family transcriptional regulator